MRAGTDDIDDYLAPRPHLPEAVAAAICADPADPRVPLVMARHLAFHPQLELPRPEDPAVLARLRKAARASGKLLAAKVRTMAVPGGGPLLIMVVDRSPAQDAIVDHAVRMSLAKVLVQPPLRLVRGSGEREKQ
jgi:hypothetical protein